MLKTSAFFTHLLVLAALGHAEDRINLKICTFRGTQDPCSQIARQNEVACNVNRLSIDCLLNIEKGTSHFGKILEEDAFLAANFIPDQVQVIGEVVRDNATAPQTVILVKTASFPSETNDLKTLLRGKKFCHPGFNHDSAFSAYLLTELESLVVEDSDYCADTQLSLIENQISALSKFLGESCRPGPWVQDKTLDGQMQSKYKSLCSLCGRSSCNGKYLNPFHDNLLCLTNRGDFALTTLKEADEFLKSFNNAQKYKSLCKNGTLSSAPCPWTEPLPALIVADSSHRQAAIDLMKTKIPKQIVNSGTTTNPDQTFSDSLITILKLEPSEKIKFLETPKPLKDYVNERRPVPTLSSSKKCDTSIKWCTINAAEQQKCEWYSQAALNRRLQPVIECVETSQTNKTLSCLDDIESGRADIAAISADLALLGLVKGLKSVAYIETAPQYLLTILLVTHANNTNIRSLQDIKGKKACLPVYSGKEFLSLIETMKKSESDNSDSCNYIQYFEDLLGSSCVPGASNLTGSSTTKLCELCQAANTGQNVNACSASEANAYYGNKGTLKCLEDYAADFAVITRPFELAAYNDSYLNVICKNGSRASYPGLNVDDNCALNVITSSEVVVNEKNANNDNFEIILEESENWFNTYLSKNFALFKEFNGTKGSLFDDNTLGILYDHEEASKYVKNYKNLFSNAEECYRKTVVTTIDPSDDNAPGSASTVQMIFSLLIVCTLINSLIK